MSDILAGMTIRAVDRPAAVTARDNTFLNDISPDAYTTGTPVVDFTFTAPTSGRVMLIVGGALRGQSGSARVLLVPEVFEGTDATGTGVLVAGAGTDLKHGFVNHEVFMEFFLASRVSSLSGLTPGATHYARLVHQVTPTAAVADIGSRDLSVVPLT